MLTLTNVFMHFTHEETRIYTLYPHFQNKGNESVTSYYIFKVNLK